MRKMLMLLTQVTSSVAEAFQAQFQGRLRLPMLQIFRWPQSGLPHQLL